MTSFFHRHLSVRLIEIFDLAEDSIKAFLFLRLKVFNFFFNRFAHDVAINLNGAFLPHSVGAVGRLVFDCRIPPGFEMKNVARLSEIQTDAASFKRHQKNGTAIACIKIGERSLSLRFAQSAMNYKRRKFECFEIGFYILQRV